MALSIAKGGAVFVYEVLGLTSVVYFGEGGFSGESLLQLC